MTGRLALWSEANGSCHRFATAVFRTDGQGYIFSKNVTKCNLQRR